MIRLLWSDQPQETRFFVLISGWALLLGIIYWFVSADLAGTALLAGLALANGAMATWLIRGRRHSRLAGRHDERPDFATSGVGVPGAGTGGVDRPFHDEEGRIPAPTLAPFAVGVGVSVALTGTVFGIAPVAVGIVPFLWGAWTWFAAARAEHDALRRQTEGRTAPRTTRRA